MENSKNSPACHVQANLLKEIILMIIISFKNIKIETVGSSICRSLYAGFYHIQKVHVVQSNILEARAYEHMGLSA